MNTGLEKGRPEGYDGESIPAGSTFGVLCAKSVKTTKNSVKVTWKKAGGAAKYLIFAAKCGKGNQFTKIEETANTSYTLKKLKDKKLAKGSYYKFVIVAVGSKNDVISTSAMVCSATLGGKVGGSFGKTIGGNVAAQLGRSIMGTLFK